MSHDDVGVSFAQDRSLAAADLLATLAETVQMLFLGIDLYFFSKAYLEIPLI